MCRETHAETVCSRVSISTPDWSTRFLPRQCGPRQLNTAPSSIFGGYGIPIPTALSGTPAFQINFDRQAEIPRAVRSLAPIDSHDSP